MKKANKEVGLGDGKVEGTISDISRRLQKVGQGALKKLELHQIDDSLFSTQPQLGLDLWGRLLRARETGVSLVEVEAIERGGEISDRLFEVFGIKEMGRLIMNIYKAGGQDPYSRFDENRLRMKSVGLVIPGEHVISATGRYRNEIESAFCVTTRDDHGFGESYSYENLDGLFFNGKRDMEKMLDEIEVSYKSWLWKIRQP